MSQRASETDDAASTGVAGSPSRLRRSGHLVLAETGVGSVVEANCAGIPAGSVALHGVLRTTKHARGFANVTTP